MPSTRFILAAALLAAVAFGTGRAAAQDGGGCVPAVLADPPRQAYDCGNGLLIEFEAGLVPDLPADGTPETVTLDGGGALVDLPPGSGDFQIRTPHAIASVRGTVFVVDVRPAETSVLVVEGAVHVSRADGSEAVLLGPGEGVDVAEGQPLEPGGWTAARAAALLARFGR